MGRQRAICKNWKKKKQQNHIFVKQVVGDVPRTTSVVFIVAPFFLVLFFSIEANIKHQPTNIKDGACFSKYTVSHKKTYSVNWTFKIGIHCKYFCCFFLRHGKKHIREAYQNLNVSLGGCKLLDEDLHVGFTMFPK